MRWTANAVEFGNKVRRAHFTRLCGVKAYTAVWTARIRFVGASVGFTREDCNNLEKPAVRECLRSAGYNGHFPRDVVFGPAIYGGIEWDDAFILMLTEQIKWQWAS